MGCRTLHASLANDSKFNSQTNILFGRVEDFLVPSGPQFPAFFSRGKINQPDDKAGCPLEISGTWHGNTEIAACLTTDECNKWDFNFAKHWNQHKYAKGLGTLTFEKIGDSSRLVGGVSVYGISTGRSEDVRQEIVSKFRTPTPEQISLIESAIAPLKSSFTINYGKPHTEKHENIAGLDIHVKSEQYYRRQLAPNVWESDSLSERKVTFSDAKEPQTIYTEGVFRLTKNEDGTLDWKTAEARYSAARKLLCSEVVIGHYSRGAIEVPYNRALAIMLEPSSRGVLITGSGSLGTECNALIPRAKLKDRTSGPVLWTAPEN